MTDGQFGVHIQKNQNPLNQETCHFVKTIPTCRNIQENKSRNSQHCSLEKKPYGLLVIVKTTIRTLSYLFLSKSVPVKSVNFSVK